MNSRVALADLLKDFADDMAAVPAHFARHADRRTGHAEDIELYFELEPYYGEP